MADPEMPDEILVAPAFVQQAWREMKRCKDGTPDRRCKAGGRVHRWLNCKLHKERMAQLSELGSYAEYQRWLRSPITGAQLNASRTA